jgi:hypothetical protein
MPAKQLADLAKQAGVSLDRAEELWKKAKSAAAKQGRADDYQYIMGILKKMLKLENSNEIVKPEIGMREMRVDKKLIESQVHSLIFKEGATTTSGTGSYGVKIRYTTGRSDTYSMQILSVRASSPEAAKAQALVIAREMDFKNVSVVEVVTLQEPVATGGAKSPKWNPSNNQAVIQHDPRSFAGLVLPTAIHPGLDTSQVLVPGGK